MATAFTKRWRHVNGNLKQVMGNVVFSGSYQDDGTESSITNAQLGLKRILVVNPCGNAKSTDLVTSSPVAVTVNAAGTSAEITLYEDNAAAAAAPLTEKTDNEAFITGCNVDIVAFGY